MTTHTNGLPTLDDSGELADRLLDVLATHFRSPLATLAPAEGAAYRRALAEVEQAHPQAPGIAPLSRLDDAVLAWVGAAFAEGARFGIAVETFRRSVAGLRPEGGA